MTTQERKEKLELIKLLSEDEFPPPGFYQQLLNNSVPFIHFLLSEIDRRDKALKSIEWITDYQTDMKDTCEVDRKLIREVLGES